ncbi:MAG: ABC transporter substrate-binding protein [Candidatus Aerophobetes bacterium]
MKNKWMLVLLVSSMVLGAAAAGVAQEIKNPDTLIVAGYGTVDSLDPAYAYDTSSGVRIINIYETLIFWDGEKTDQFIPMLATKVPSLENGLLAPDGLTYTFPIRAGVKFHNGEVMTPEDVEYSFERAMVLDPSGGPIWMLLEPLLGVGSTRKGDEIAVSFEDIDKAVEVEGNNIVFHLKQPYPPFLSVLSNQWGAVVSKKFVVENGGWPGTAETFNDFNNPESGEETLHAISCGTGPFELERWEPGVETVLVRNDDYWKDPAKLKRVVVKFVEEWTTRKLMFLAGDVDVVQVDTQYIREMEDLEGIRVHKNLPVLACTAAFYNFQINPEGNADIGSAELDGQGIPPDFFSDKDVRLGFSYSFDWDIYLRDVWLGEAYQPVSPIVRGLPYLNPDQPVYKYDKAKAEEHFKKAWGGQVWEKGFKMTILYNIGNAQRRTAAHMFEDNLEVLNPKFSIDVRPVDWATYVRELRKNTLTLFIIGWLADYPDPHNFIHPFMHTNGAFSAFQSYSDPRVDALIEQGVATVDPEERKDIYYELQAIYYEDVPSVGIYQQLQRRYERDWVQGWYFNTCIPDFQNTGYAYPIWKGYTE